MDYLFEVSDDGHDDVKSETSHGDAERARKREREVDGDDASGYEREDEERQHRRRGRKLAEGLLSGLLEGGAAFRRGQDRVTGVAQGTKDELLRLVGAEVRNFLDRMDAVDLMQQVVSGLTIDVHASISIRRDADGKLKSEVNAKKVELEDRSDDED